jgi:23S rRNA pseudouridine1911/1915/1917 synthase
MASEQPTELQVSDEQAGLRLDVFLASMCPERSRVHLRRAITEGCVLVDGRQAKPAYRLNPGQRVTLELPDLPRETPAPEPMALSILYEDTDLVAINKPPGLVVHPSRGHLSGTLANALTHHFAQLSGVGGACRPGIVHRLDRDTSGIVVVAKTDAAHMALAAQWENRTIVKQYFAIVAGVPDRDRDRIDQPIGMHPQQREKMAIRAGHTTSRQASTFYEVQERFAGYAALHVHPLTGRTHQIRVHLTHIGYPVLCDRVYGGRSQITLGDLQHTDDATVLLARQALHASHLRLSHPRTGAVLELEAPLPDDIVRLLEALRRWCGRR